MRPQLDHELFKDLNLKKELHRKWKVGEMAENGFQRVAHYVGKARKSLRTTDQPGA